MINNTSKSRSLPLDLIERAVAAIRQGCEMMEPYYYQLGAESHLKNVAEELELYLPLSVVEAHDGKACPVCHSQFRTLESTLQHCRAKHQWDQALEDSFIEGMSPKAFHIDTKAEYLATLSTRK